MLWGLTRPVRRACSRRESGTVGLGAVFSAGVASLVGPSTLVRPGHRPGPELDSLFDQAGCSPGPAMPGGLTRLVKRAGSRTDREN